MQLFALAIIIVGAALIGLAIANSLNIAKDTQMANSASQLTAAIAPLLETNSAKDQTIATLQTDLAAARADLAADEQAIADVLAKLAAQSPAPTVPTA